MIIVINREAEYTDYKRRKYIKYEDYLKIIRVKGGCINMKKSNIFLGLGWFMVIAAVVFIIFGKSHPEMSFIWSNVVTYSIYILYVIITAVMFIMAKKSK